VQKEKFMENGNRFVDAVTVFEGNYLLRHDLNPARKSIRLVYVGNAISEEQKQSIRELAKEYSLNDIELIIEEGFSLPESGLVKEEELFKNEIGRLSLMLQSKEKALDSINSISYTGQKLLTEIKSLYPQIKSCNYSESIGFNVQSTDAKKTLIVVFGTDKVLSAGDRKKINLWVKARLGVEEIKVLFE
jgi:hypothetical protein